MAIDRRLGSSFIPGLVRAPTLHPNEARYYARQGKRQAAAFLRLVRAACGPDATLADAAALLFNQRGDAEAVDRIYCQEAALVALAVQALMDRAWQTAHAARPDQVDELMKALELIADQIRHMAGKAVMRGDRNGN